MAGLTAAARLADRGLSSLVVEQDLFPGGHCARLTCKAAEACARCNACLLEEAMAELAGRTHVRLAYRTTAAECRRQNGRLEVRLNSAPLFLDPDRCVDCGLCFKECPARGRAIRWAPAPLFGPRYGLDPGPCLSFQGRGCRACIEVCPAEAIDLSAGGREETLEARAVIVAAGVRPFDPSLKPRYGAGRLPDVISALDLEGMLRQRGELQRPSDGRRPERMAFIQCVGSRDKRLGRDYCSRVCCGYALRLARLIRHRWPRTLVSMFYMDLQTFGRDFDRSRLEASGEVELIRGVPGEITAGPKGALTVPFSSEATGAIESRRFDLVVLSVGLGGPAEGLEEVFGLSRDEDGFLIGRPQDGLFVAGAATGPLDAAESRAQAEGLAARAAQFIKGRS